MSDIYLFVMEHIHPRLLPPSIVKWLGDKLDFKANNILCKIEQFKKRTICYSTPQSMEIWTTNVCNINPPCVMCYKPEDSNHIQNSFHLPSKYLSKIAKFVSKCDTVSLHGGGEPLTCKNLFEPLKYISENTKAGFVTNGLLLNEDNIKKILENKISYLEFSIDAATTETYFKIRHNDLNVVKRNILRLVEKRDAMRLDYPQVHINMCVMRENMKEIPDFVRMGKALGAVSVHLVHMNKGSDYQYGWFNYKDQHCELEPDAHDHYMQLGFDVADELGIQLRVSGKKYFKNNESLEQIHNYDHESSQTQRFYCDLPWKRLIIAPDGNIRNCCYQNKPLGNLADSSINDIWNNELSQQVRSYTLNGKPHPHCINSTGNQCLHLGRV